MAIGYDVVIGSFLSHDELVIGLSVSHDELAIGFTVSHDELVIGSSVILVGTAAQSKAMKQAFGNVKLEQL